MKKFLLVCFIFFSVGVAWAYKLNTEVPLPGKTIANTKLQVDTLLPVYTVALSNVHKNCKTASVIDTKVVRRPEHLVKKNNIYVEGDWGEVWTVQACSKKIDIPITFILDKTGASYLIEASKIKFLE